MISVHRGLKTEQGREESNNEPSRDHLTHDRLGGRIQPTRFFLNNVRSVAAVEAKLGIHFSTSISRPHTKFWNFFYKTPKNGIYVVKPCPDIWHANSKVDISIFVKHIAQKRWWRHFKLRFWGFPDIAQNIKMTFLEFWDQTGSETQIFYSKISIR